ncbi:hypothetical protein [Actinoplanes sp. ATCC 53533]|uniref:hypothetical protein n=1 Tax=Actinoplanes sp. ATCC 53533 TaxID=1288362 RepID=UPI000F77CA8F|nr:hypothetical protein [Actinoplanes sp. ATCC 53533]
MSADRDCGLVDRQPVGVDDHLADSGVGEPVGVGRRPVGDPGQVRDVAAVQAVAGKPRALPGAPAGDPLSQPIAPGLQPHQGEFRRRECVGVCADLVMRVGRADYDQEFEENRSSCDFAKPQGTKTWEIPRRIDPESRQAFA